MGQERKVNYIKGSTQLSLYLGHTVLYSYPGIVLLRSQSWKNFQLGSGTILRPSSRIILLAICLHKLFRLKHLNDN